MDRGIHRNGRHITRGSNTTDARTLKQADSEEETVSMMYELRCHWHQWCQSGAKNTGSDWTRPSDQHVNDDQLHLGGGMSEGYREKLNFVATRSTGRRVGLKAVRGFKCSTKPSINTALYFRLLTEGYVRWTWTQTSRARAACFSNVSRVFRPFRCGCPAGVQSETKL